MTSLIHPTALIDPSTELGSNVKITDESTLMELAGFKIKIIIGDSSNLKITRKIDWEVAKIIESGK